MFIALKYTCREFEVLTTSLSSCCASGTFFVDLVACAASRPCLGFEALVPLACAWVQFRKWIEETFDVTDCFQPSFCSFCGSSTRIGWCRRSGIRCTRRCSQHSMPARMCTRLGAKWAHEGERWYWLLEQFTQAIAIFRQAARESLALVSKSKHSGWKRKNSWNRSQNRNKFQRLDLSMY